MRNPNPVGRWRLSVRVGGVLETLTGVCQHEFSEFDTAQSKHPVRDRLDLFASALHEDDFQAVMMIQMDMRGGEHPGPRRVLHFGQLFREIRNVMIVHKRQSANYWLVRLDGFGEKRFTDQIAECLGTVRVTALPSTGCGGRR